VACRLCATAHVRQSGFMRKALATLVDRRTWAELLYALIGLPLGILGFVFVVVSLAVSVSLAITVVGILLLAVAVSAARGFGAAYRGLGRSLLMVDVETPPVDRRRSGLTGYLTERNGWRAILFLLLRFPLAILDFTVAVAFWSYGVGGISYPLWWHLVKQGHRGAYRHGAQIGPHFFLDTPVRISGVFVVGVILLLAAPWVLRGVLSIDRALIRGLLGPTASSKRIRTLEDTRAMAVDDSAASLRRIERDLHDGAQARLVSLAMSLGMAKEELDKEGLDSDDPDAALARVRTLVDSAHREAKGTIVDLRDLARGIHPPALDSGLPEALATLTARCSIPTTLHVELPDRPSPAVETIVYFCTAELLTNIVKHSGAHHASVDVRTVGGQLFVRAGDDGAGGAATGRSGGSGLAGLADRVATVDGRLDIASPEGGPTLVTIEIPI
jgi:signal transduction histidine kinase